MNWIINFFILAPLLFISAFIGLYIYEFSPLKKEKKEALFEIQKAILSILAKSGARIFTDATDHSPGYFGLTENILKGEEKTFYKNSSVLGINNWITNNKIFSFLFEKRVEGGLLYSKYGEKFFEILELNDKEVYYLKEDMIHEERRNIYIQRKRKAANEEEAKEMEREDKVKAKEIIEKKLKNKDESIIDFCDRKIMYMIAIEHPFRAFMELLQKEFLVVEEKEVFFGGGLKKKEIIARITKKGIDHLQYQRWQAVLVDLRYNPNFLLLIALWGFCVSSSLMLLGALTLFSSLY